MSDDTNERSDDELLGAIADTLAPIPHDEAEVARAEADGVEDVSLPDHLAAWSPIDEEAADEGADGGAEVVDLVAFRHLRAIATHGVALALGAAAAAALTFGEPTPTPPSPPPAGSPTGTAAPALIELSTPACEACCGGEACAKDATPCPSGRTCVPCDTEALEAGHFRVLLGAVQAAGAGAKVLDDYPRGEPELCVRAGVSQEVCVPTLVARRGDEGLDDPQPLLFAGADLKAGVSLRLRWKGVPQRIETAARWSQPVALTPDALCKGYLIRLTTDDDEVFGRVSLLLEDAQFVEVGRGPDLGALKAIRENLLTTGLTPAVVAVPDGHALVLGPVSLPVATTLHQQALDQALSARLTLGRDHRGPPVPLPR